MCSRLKPRGKLSTRKTSLSIGRYSEVFYLYSISPGLSQYRIAWLIKKITGNVRTYLHCMWVIMNLRYFMYFVINEKIVSPVLDAQFLWYDMGVPLSKLCSKGRWDICWNNKKNIIKLVFELIKRYRSNSPTVDDITLYIQSHHVCGVKTFFCGNNEVDNIISTFFHWNNFLKIFLNSQKLSISIFVVLFRWFS